MRRMLAQKRDRVAREAAQFRLIFERVKRECTEELLQSLGILGRRANTQTGYAAPSVQRDVGYHLRRIDETLKTAIPELHDLIDASTDRTYLDAVNEARIRAELDRVGSVEKLGDSVLYEPTISWQRQIMRDYLTTAIVRTGATTGRVINAWGASEGQRAAIAEAVQYGQLRGRGLKGIADEVFSRLNEAGGFPDDLKDAVVGKFVTVNGRTFDLSQYSEIVAEAQTSRLYNDAARNEYTEDGYELVQVDDHDTTADICRPFEGTIWSITGSQVGQYKPIEQCYNGGPPFHPRCTHYLDPIDTKRTKAGAVRISGALYDRKQLVKNDAVKAAEARLGARINAYPATALKVVMDRARAEAMEAAAEQENIETGSPAWPR